jgi:hypothetical protein
MKIEHNEELLKVVYEQCNSVAALLLRARIQMLSLFVYNAALFYFVHRQQSKSDALIILVSSLCMLFTIALFLVEIRNRRIMVMVETIANNIENYFKTPKTMCLYHLVSINSGAISYRNIYTVLTVLFTLFWVLYIFFHAMF